MKLKLFAASMSGFPLFVVGLFVFIYPVNITLRPLGIGVLLLSVFWIVSACVWVYNRELKRRKDCGC